MLTAYKMAFGRYFGMRRSHGKEKQITVSTYGTICCKNVCAFPYV